MSRAIKRFRRGLGGLALGAMVLVSWASAGFMGQFFFVTGFVGYVVMTWGLMSWRSRLMSYLLAVIVAEETPGWIDLAVGRTDPNSWRGIYGIISFAFTLYLGWRWLWPYRRRYDSKYLGLLRRSRAGE